MPTFIGGPSLHLTWKELMCHDGTAYPAQWRQDRAVRLAAAFEAIRAVWDQPIRIASAYRTPVYNSAVGGSPRSQHLQGLALDLQPPEGVSVRHFWEEIVRLAPAVGIYGIGYASDKTGNFVHIDLRLPPLVQWTY